MKVHNKIIDIINNSVNVKNQIVKDNEIILLIQEISELIINCYKNNSKVLFCGNGGSAADAQHLAAELSGRFYYDRQPLQAEALHVNTSYMTAVANDYSFEQVYSRLIKAMGNKGDILFAISTSGNSLNIINAIKEANNKGMITIGLTGDNGGKMKDICTKIIKVPSGDTPRIQESHIMIGHIICQLVEESLFPR